MSRRVQRFVLLLLLVGVPTALYWALAERVSWRPRHLAVGISLGSVAFSPDGRTLACAGAKQDAENTQIELWDVGTQRLLWRRDAVCGPADLAFSPDGRLLLHRDGRYDGLGVGVLQLSSGQDTLAKTKGADSRAIFGDLDDHNITGSTYRASRFDSICVTAFWPNAQTVAVAGDGDEISTSPDATQWVRVRLWNVQTHKLRQLNFKAAGNYAAEGNSIGATVLSPDGHTIATALAGRKAFHNGLVANENEIWLDDILDVGQRGPTVIGRIEKEKIYQMCFSPDGQVLASCESPYGSIQADVRLWDVRSAKLLHTLPMVRSHFDTSEKVLAFTLDGQIIATADTDQVRLWHVGTGRLLRTIQGVRGVVKALAISADGSTLAVADRDNTVTLWRIH